MKILFLEFILWLLKKKEKYTVSVQSESARKYYEKFKDKPKSKTLLKLLNKKPVKNNNFHENYRFPKLAIKILNYLFVNSNFLMDEDSLLFSDYKRKTTKLGDLVNKQGYIKNESQNR